MNMKSVYTYEHADDTSSRLNYLTSLAYGGVVQRDVAWSNNGFLGHWIRSLKTIDIQYRSVFMHAGLHPEILETYGGINGINSVVWDLFDRGKLSHPIFGSTGPFWYRGFAQGREDLVCPMLKIVLLDLDADRMVVCLRSMFDTIGRTYVTRGRKNPNKMSYVSCTRWTGRAEDLYNRCWLKHSLVCPLSG